MPNIADQIRILAMQTVEASKPVERVFGVVIAMNPFTIQVNEKLVLDEDFLAITQTVKNYINWKFIDVGDKVVMTRQKGGQLYIVDDMLACDKVFNHTHEYIASDGTTQTTTIGKRVK